MEAATLALKRFDAYSFLQDREAAIVTGPSGNNLRDLRMLLTRSLRKP
jgi:glycerate-2-kinase